MWTDFYSEYCEEIGDDFWQLILKLVNKSIYKYLFTSKKCFYAITFFLWFINFENFPNKNIHISSFKILVQVYIM